MKMKQDAIWIQRELLMWRCLQNQVSRKIESFILPVISQHDLLLQTSFQKSLKLIFILEE